MEGGSSSANPVETTTVCVDTPQSFGIAAVITIILLIVILIISVLIIAFLVFHYKKLANNQNQQRP